MMQKIQKMAVREQIVKTVVRSGNGGAVWVPKSWLGEEVVVMLPEKPRLGLKERVMRILEPHLKDIVSAGIYGSYARNEQTKDSDIDVLVITSGRTIPIQAKTHANGENVEIAVFQIDKLKAFIEKYPAAYYQMVQEAVPLINASALEELRKIRPRNFTDYMEDTREHLKSSRELLELDKLDGTRLKSFSALYSALLRLKGLLIIRCILSKEKFSSAKFKKLVISKGLNNKEFDDSHRIFRLVRDGKSTRDVRIEISIAEKLLGILDKEMKEMEARISDKQKKETAKRD